MEFRLREFALAVGLAVGALAVPAQAQLPPPPPPPATLWSFLGIPQAYRGFRDSLNARGNRPGLERKPPMKAIADPNNLKSDVPAIKKAAEVKMAEDLAPQKIKAVKYLAGIGCGCYNRDGSITDALIKAMDDCTEEVRLQTVWAISEAAAGEACANCKQRSCCSEEISNKLYEIAYERDDSGCFLEPSERVRLAAAEALRTCCPGGDEDFIIQTAPPPIRGETPGAAPEGGGERPGAVPLVPTPAPPPPAVVPPAPAPAAGPASPRSSRRTAANEAPSAKTSRQAVLIGRPLQLDDSRASAHWAAVKNCQAAYVTFARRGTLAMFDPPIPNSVLLAEATRPMAAAENQSAGNKPALTRLPPIDAPPANPIASPPLPPVGTPAIPVSIRHKSSPSAGAEGTASVLRPQPASATTQSTPEATSAELSKRTRPAIPMSQREIPGVQYGTGMVRAIRAKEGVALLEFANEMAVPPGSVVRAYHEFALTGKTAVCDLEVVRGEGGVAAAVPRAGSELSALSIGDRAIVLR